MATTDDIANFADRAKPRIAWPDCAKGLAILLVVVHHSIQYAVADGIAPEWWTSITEMLRTLRMPLFFMAAGLFARTWSERSWQEVISRKILLLGWVYVLWIFVRAGWFEVAPGGGTRESPGLVTLLERIIWPLPGWFLFTLAAFFVILRATRRIDPRIQLVVATAASVAWLPGHIGVDNLGWDGVPTYYVFFLIGVHRYDWMMKKTSDISVILRISIVAAWISAYVILDQLALVDAPVLSFALRIAGLAAGVAIACSCTHIPGLQSVGRATLPIYVAHLLIVIPVVYLLAEVSFMQSTAWVQVICPIAIGAIALAITYGFGILAGRIRMGWLFATPKTVESTVARMLSGNRT